MTMSDMPCVCLKGVVGAANTAIEQRLRREPFNSLAWLRADLTGEKVSQYDGIEEHPWYRPFKNFSGDISGRYLEVMSQQRKGERPEELLNQLKEAIREHQQPGGYFSASGPIDWEQPIDYGNLYTDIMMPALWGNSRMLCGLVAAVQDGCPPALEKCARNLGDFYAHVLSRFTSDDHMDEFRAGGSFAAGYVTCYFPAIEGLVRLFQVTKEQRYLDTAIQMAEFYELFDIIPIDHSHGMLCCQVGLLLLHEMTGDNAYLNKVEARWDELVTGGYINPAGGILEKCRPVYYRDEGCALTDWLRLNLRLARITGRPRYWDMAERVLYNHLLQNQFDNGGFGHRKMIKGANGILGFAEKLEEATWCCCYHGLLAFQILKQYIVSMDSEGLHLPLAVDFDADLPDNRLTAKLIDEGPGSPFRYAIHLEKPAMLNVRIPSWAGTTSVRVDGGEEISCDIENGWLRTPADITELTLFLENCQHTDHHHPDESGAMTQTFCYHGPWVSQGERCSSTDASPNESENFIFTAIPKDGGNDGMKE